MEVLTIKTEGPRADKPRRVHRVWVKTLSNSSNGTTLEGHHVKGYTRGENGPEAPKPQVVELYLDRIGEALKRTRTNDHREARKLAESMADSATSDWVKDHKARVDACPPEEREAFISRMKGNLQPEHFYRLIPALKDGYPPLEYCRVVNPRTYEEMDAFDFVKLDRAAQAEWLVEPPMTPETASDIASDKIADAIARAFNRANKK